MVHAVAVAVMMGGEHEWEKEIALKAQSPQVQKGLWPDNVSEAIVSWEWID